MRAGRAVDPSASRAKRSSRRSSDLRDGEDPGAGRRQFDGQREPVEGPAQLRHGGIGGIDGGGAALARPPGEERDGVGLRQRSERSHGLAVEPERATARGEDVHARRRVAQCGHERGHVVDEVLAVVEEEQDIAPAQARRPVEARQHRGDRGRHVRRWTQRVEADQPGAARGAGRVRGLDREPGLADARRPDERDERLRGDRLAEAGELGRAPDERPARCRDVPARCGDRIEPAIVVQHLRVQVAQLGAGIGAELGGQDPGDPRVRGERVGLPAGAVQRGDQQCPEPFAQRMLADQFLQLTRHLAGGTERDPGRQPVLGEPQPGVGQPGPVGERPCGRPGGGQDLRREQREPGRARAGRRGRVARGELRGARVRQPHRLERVDRARVDGERVPRGATRQQRRVAEHPAQLRHLGLQRVGAHPRLVGPQVVQQPFRPDRVAGVEGEPHEQLRRQPGGHGHGDAGTAHRHRPEHRDRQHRASLGRRAPERTRLTHRSVCPRARPDVCVSTRRCA